MPPRMNIGNYSVGTWSRWPDLPFSEWCAVVKGRWEGKTSRRMCKILMWTSTIIMMPQWAEPQSPRHTRRSHFLRDRWKLRPKTCNASLTQYHLEIKLVNFGLVALLSSYGMICSPWRMLPAVQTPAKNKSLTAGCLSTWQFNLYNNSNGDSSEIQRTRLPKLHSLSFAINTNMFRANREFAQTRNSRFDG